MGRLLRCRSSCETICRGSAGFGTPIRTVQGRYHVFRISEQLFAGLTLGRSRSRHSPESLVTRRIDLRLTSRGSPTSPCSGLSVKHCANRATLLWARASGNLAKPPFHLSHTTSNLKDPGRSEEHTSELQSRGHLVCRLLLE